MSDPHTSVSVVVPVYCARKHLKAFHERLHAVLEQMAMRYEIIYVDDHSTDESFALLEEISATCPQVIAVRLGSNVGQQHATFCGLTYARYSYVITIDDDGQYPPEEIPRLVELIRSEDLDCVYAIPKARSTSVYRNLGTRLTDCTMYLLTRKPGDIQVSSFRIMRRHLVDLITETSAQSIYLSVEILSRTHRVGNCSIESISDGQRTRYTFAMLLKVFLKLVIGNRPWCRRVQSTPRFIVERELIHTVSGGIR